MKRISMWTNYFIDSRPEEMVELFASKGWFELEFSDEHGHELLARGGDAANVGKAFRAWAQGKGVSFPQGHLWLTADLCAQDGGKTLDKLKSWLDLYVALRVKAAVLHPGGHTLAKEGVGLERIAEIRMESLRKLTGHLAGTDMRIALENLFKNDVPLAKDLIPIIDAFQGKNLGICLDTGHLNLEKGDPGEFIRQVGNRLCALHIADNEGQVDQHLMSYGRGMVNWKRFSKAMAESNYKGVYNLEIPGESRCPREVALHKLDYLKNAMTFLLEKECTQ